MEIFNVRCINMADLSRKWNFEGFLRDQFLTIDPSWRFPSSSYHVWVCSQIMLGWVKTVFCRFFWRWLSLGLWLARQCLILKLPNLFYLANHRCSRLSLPQKYNLKVNPVFILTPNVQLGGMHLLRCWVQARCRWAEHIISRWHCDITDISDITRCVPIIQINISPGEAVQRPLGPPGRGVTCCVKWMSHLDADFAKIGEY